MMMMMNMVIQKMRGERVRPQLSQWKESQTAVGAKFSFKLARHSHINLMTATYGHMVRVCVCLSA